MNKEDLDKLLDNIYELEGLVHLALNRDDNPASLPELICRKGEELCRLAKKTAGAEESDKDSVWDAAYSQEPLQEEPVEITDEPVEITDEPVEIPEEAKDEPVETYAVETEEAPVVVEEREEVMEEAVNTVAQPAPMAEPRGRLVFSINDRYRFKKELFGGSDAEFNTTLALVASMEGYDEAEDYFLGELQWDPRKPEVSDFLEIIKRYFN